MSFLKKIKNLLLALASPVINIKFFIRGIVRYPSFVVDLLEYKKMKGSEKISLLNISPRLHDRSQGAGVADSSLFQNIWAFDLIKTISPVELVDVGSHTQLIGMLSRMMPITYIDIRPFNVEIKNLTFKKGSILELPFEDKSVNSISCLHTIEHIGLGRYGDPLDPKGTIKAIKELQRVVGSGGNVILSTPVGKPKLVFNAHRIFHPQTIIDSFDELELIELSGIGKNKVYQKNIDIDELAGSEHGLGLFWFKRN